MREGNIAAVRQWLKELQLERYTEVFEAEKVDVESLSYIKEDNLEKLGIPLGPRLKILAAVSTQSEAQSTESLAAVPPSLATPETNPPWGKCTLSFRVPNSYFEASCQDF